MNNLTFKMSPSKNEEQKISFDLEDPYKSFIKSTNFTKHMFNVTFDKSIPSAGNGDKPEELKSYEEQLNQETEKWRALCSEVLNALFVLKKNHIEISRDAPTTAKQEYTVSGAPDVDEVAKCLLKYRENWNIVRDKDFDDLKTQMGYLEEIYKHRLETVKEERLDVRLNGYHSLNRKNGN